MIVALLPAPSMVAAGAPVYLPLVVKSPASGTWSEVGAGSASGGGISNNDGRSEMPSLALAPDGTPYVAWYDETGGSFEIFVRRYAP